MYRKPLLNHGDELFYPPVFLRLYGLSQYLQGFSTSQVVPRIYSGDHASVGWSSIQTLAPLPERTSIALKQRKLGWDPGGGFCLGPAELHVSDIQRCSRLLVGNSWYVIICIYVSHWWVCQTCLPNLFLFYFLWHERSKKTFMTSQIVPGANQQFHKTPLFWEAKKVPRQCCLQADFPIGNLKLFTALAGLKPQTGWSWKPWEIFSGCILQPRKVEFRHVLKLFVFSNCRSLGIQYSSHCYTKNWWFFFGEAKKKLKEIKKSFNTWQLQPFPESETTGETIRIRWNNDDTLLRLWSPWPRSSPWTAGTSQIVWDKTSIHPWPTDQRTNTSRHVTSHLNEKVLKWVRNGLNSLHPETLLLAKASSDSFRQCGW